MCSELDVRTFEEVIWELRNNIWSLHPNAKVKKIVLNKEAFDSLSNKLNSLIGNKIEMNYGINNGSKCIRVFDIEIEVL